MLVKPPNELGKGNDEQQHPTFWRDELAKLEAQPKAEPTTNALLPIDGNQRKLAILHKRKWKGYCEYCGMCGHEEFWCIRRRADCVEYAEQYGEELYEGDIMLDPEDLPHDQRSVY